MNKQSTNKFILKFENNLFKDTLSFLLQNEIEQFCFLFCHTSISPEGITIFPKEIIIFENDPQIVQQHSLGIRIDQTVINEAYFRFIESNYTAIINCHSHPFESDDVWFSGVDDDNDIAYTEHFHSEVKKARRNRNNNLEIFYLSMVFGQKTIGARDYNIATRRFNPSEQIVVIGEPIQYIIPTNNSKKPSLTKESQEIFDRQILAFGEMGQKKLSELIVSIIGVGGVGSIIVEGLCRLGVRKFVLVDPDKIEKSNLNRFQGALYTDIGKSKVDVCTRNLQQMFPDVQVKKFQESLFQPSVVETIKHTDCLIGCLDNPETRYFLNRLSLQFLIPYIDSGVIIRSDGTSIDGLDMRMGLVIPGVTRCFDCSAIKYYEKEKVKEYFLDAETRQNLVKHGYIKGTDEITTPAVYPLNLNVSSFVLFEFLNLFTGYKKTYWNIVMNYLELSSNKKKCLNTHDDFEPRTGSCLNCEVYKAVGDYQPLSYFMSRNRVVPLP